MKDLGLQAVSHIMAAAEHGRDPLERLVSVSGNFPSFARWLSKQPVDPKLREEVMRNQGYVRLSSLCRSTRCAHRTFIGSM